MEQELAGLRRGRHEDVTHRHPGQADTHRVHQDEPVHAAGMAQGQLGAEPAPERQADHVGPVEPERVEDVEGVEDQVLHRLDRLEPFGGAEAGVHGQEHPAAARQEVVDGHPAEGAGPVEVEERTAGPALEALDAPAVDGEGALAIGGRYGVFHHVQVTSRETIAQSPGGCGTGPRSCRVDAPRFPAKEARTCDARRWLPPWR